MKISHDPNNTTWSRSNTGFGHKILASQGWTPGSYLGAQNPPQASGFTAAGPSHIRVLLKDDNLGLGAQKSGPVEKQRTGHDSFQGLLVRLNGKSDEQFGKERNDQDEKEAERHLRTKHNLIQFVKGGLLVQDKIGVDAAVATKSGRTKNGNQQLAEKASEKQPHRETRLTRQKDGSEASNMSEKALRRAVKEKRRAEKAAGLALEGRNAEADDAAAANDVSHEIREKTGERAKHNRLRNEKEGLMFTRTEDEGLVVDSNAESRPESLSASQRLKKRKDKREAALEEEQRRPPRDIPVNEAAKAVSGSMKPPASSAQTHKLEGRHAIRNRFIMQKKRAMMDSKALDEIFAIK